MNTSSAPAFRTLETRRRLVPILSTLAGSATAAIPAIAPAPMWPPLGLLMLLAWRLLRPEIWPVWIGLPLGLADDLLTGQTLGTGMVVWTLCLLLVDAVEGRLLWRDYWQEWVLAAVLIAAAVLAAWGISRFTGGLAPAIALAPQIVISILCFPVVGRVCATLDNWRLAVGKIRPSE